MNIYINIEIIINLYKMNEPQNFKHAKIDIQTTCIDTVK
jgi:hypothetical protein